MKIPKFQLTKKLFSKTVVIISALAAGAFIPLAAPLSASAWGGYGGYGGGYGGGCYGSYCRPYDRNNIVVVVTDGGRGYGY